MAQIVQLHQPSPTQTTLWDATRAFLASVDLAASTLEVYEATFEHLIDGVELAGDTDISKISRAALKRHLDERYGTAAPPRITGTSPPSAACSRGVKRTT